VFFCLFNLFFHLHDQSGEIDALTFLIHIFSPEVEIGAATNESSIMKQIFINLSQTSTSLLLLVFQNELNVGKERNKQANK
jgi:hypothetical protein